METPINFDAYAALLQHGGNIRAARALFPDAPAPWIDLSTGINPFAYPLPPITPHLWARLPEQEAIQSLEAQAAQFYGAPNNASVIAASGSQGLIQLIPHYPQADDIRILGFTYSGHKNAWEATGKTLKTVDTFAELFDATVAIVVNPNNPDGRLVAPQQLLQLAKHLTTKGGFLIVDEAFMDFFDPSCSLIPQLPGRGVIVLRSFGKTFGLAGVRLGIAVCTPDIGKRLRDLVGSWAISGPALEIGKAAFQDISWLSTMRNQLQDASHQLDILLAQIDTTIIGGTTLFRFIAHPKAQELFQHLAAHGILVRPFRDFPEKLRFGIPGNQSHWERLNAALSNFNG